MKFKVRQKTAFNPSPVSIRCPHCGKQAAMAPIGQPDVDVGNNIWCGQRECPNPECRGHVFVVLHQGRIVQAYPPATIDFNSEGIPANVVRSFDEALRCHATGCFMASALMVRRTLEEVCLDKGATGKDLKSRITDLRSKIIVPNELFDAMDELRLLGNNAAHIEAQSYDKVSTEEVEVAIEFAKEMLKALYQYSGLLSKLRGLKKSP